MPHSRFDFQELVAMRGKPVYGANGEKIGEFEDIYHDAATKEPEWIGIKESTMGGLLGTKHYLVPVIEAQISDEGRGGPAIHVPYSKEEVSGSPQVEGETIDEVQERELYAYYGLQPSEQRSETQLPETESAQERSAGTPGEMSVGRSEEELRVGKRETQAGRVRLRKWVETEPVTEDVQLRRETARVERHQVDRPASGGEIGEEEAEMQLYREEPVVGKETVEKERITVHREEETEKETVRGDVRREHVEVEDDSQDSPGRHR